MATALLSNRHRVRIVTHAIGGDRLLTRTVVEGVVLFLSILLSLALAPSPAFARQIEARPLPEDATPMPPELLDNIRVDDVLQPVVVALLARSDTFRRQWATITAARLIRVTI